MLHGYSEYHLVAVLATGIGCARLFSSMQKSRFSHNAAHILLMCLSNALCYHGKYDLFCFMHCLQPTYRSRL